MTLHSQWAQALVGPVSADSRSKFDRHGNARPFAGNTVICDIDADSELGRYGGHIASSLSNSDSGDKWAILPPASWHMTVIQLIADRRRELGEWSSHLPMDCSLEEADRHMARAMGSIEPLCGIAMRCCGIHVGNGVYIKLSPARPEVEEALSGYRDAVAAATGVRRRDHDSYVFHMGLAYRLDALTVPEADDLKAVIGSAHGVLDDSGAAHLGNPYLAFFDDMTSFRRCRGDD